MIQRFGDKGTSGRTSPFWESACDCVRTYLLLYMSTFCFGNPSISTMMAARSDGLEVDKIMVSEDRRGSRLDFLTVCPPRSTDGWQMMSFSPFWNETDVLTNSDLNVGDRLWECGEVLLGSPHHPAPCHLLPPRARVGGDEVFLKQHPQHYPFTLCYLPIPKQLLPLSCLQLPITCSF